MAKKDNTLLWVAGIGIAGYLYYQYTQSQAAHAVTTANNTAANASTGTLALPPSPPVNTSAGNSTTPPNVVAPVTNAPTNNALNVTNLVPITENPAGQLALTPDNNPILTSGGIPMVFKNVSANGNVVPGNVKPAYLTALSGTYDGGECL